MTIKVGVAGAGGMIGGFMVKRLLEEGYDVRASDVKLYDDWLQIYDDAENVRTDCSTPDGAQVAVDDCEWVFNFAANMGGIEFIMNDPVSCLHSVDITSNMIREAYWSDVERYAFSSSACRYNETFQMDPSNPGLKEDDAWPAQPDSYYGFEKLMGEQFNAAYHDMGFDTRTMVYHNIYSGGPTTFEGGREKAPAAIARKVAEAVITGADSIVLLGDGQQSRTFCWIDDCIEGTLRLMKSNFTGPLNIGSSELVTIDQLAYLTAEIAGVELSHTYDKNGHTGVRGRSSDNTLIKKVLGWEPTTSLKDGMTELYAWVYDQVKDAHV